MSCRHSLANGTCIRCYPSNPFQREDRDRVDPGPEEDCGPNLEGPGAVPAPVPVIAWTVVAIGASAKFGVATVRENVAGYAIDASKGLADTWAAAHATAKRANDDADVSPEEAWRIVESSMAASRAAGARWGPQ
jgi:hypothetical protein